MTKSHDYIMIHIYYSYIKEKDEYENLIIRFINNYIEIYSLNNNNNFF